MDSLSLSLFIWFQTYGSRFVLQILARQVAAPRGCQSWRRWMRCSARRNRWIDGSMDWWGFDVSEWVQWETHPEMRLCYCRCWNIGNTLGCSMPELMVWTLSWCYGAFFLLQSVITTYHGIKGAIYSKQNRATTQEYPDDFADFCTFNEVAIDRRWVIGEVIMQVTALSKKDPWPSWQRVSSSPEDFEVEVLSRPFAGSAREESKLAIVGT